MTVRATIFPQFALKPEELGDVEGIVSRIPQLAKFLTEVPFHSTPVMTLSTAHFDGMIVEDYQFVITRRFRLGGELHIGGANGEVLNVDTFISGFTAYLEEQLNLRDRSLKD
jgi:hypothetical protein